MIEGQCAQSDQNFAVKLLSKVLFIDHVYFTPEKVVFFLPRYFLAKNKTKKQRRGFPFILRKNKTLKLA